MKSTVKDMTVGSPTRLILGFTLPMLLGMLFQQFYSMVDAIVVGKWIGTEALAGVGSTGSVNFLILGLCNGIGSGFAIPVSQRFGAKDFDSLRKYVANAIWGSLMLVIPVTVLVSIFTRDILVLMQTPDDVIEYAYGYIFVIFLGIPIAYTYNLLAAMIRALGDSRSPVIFLVIAALLNIALDILSVGVLNLGVEGPALATLISQGISATLCFLYMRKKFDILHLRRDDLRLEWRRIGTLLSIGLPMGLQYSITAIGTVVLQWSVNGLGTAAVAAMAAGGKVNQFFAVVLDSLGTTMATYAGQNTGSGKLRRIDRGLRSAMLLGAGYSVVALVVLYFFGQNVAMIFLDADEVAILGDVGYFLVATSAFYVLLAVVNNFRFTIQGMGFSVLAIVAGVLEMIARTWIGFGFVGLLGFKAACFASPLAWVFASAFLIPAYFFCRNHLKKTLGLTE
ncbi:MAG: MATE family efflux transporter [Clostridia bacterium]|nr:MATE family efflux transporter [Clostridia bacterium]